MHELKRSQAPRWTHVTKKNTNTSVYANTLPDTSTQPTARRPLGDLLAGRTAAKESEEQEQTNTTKQTDTRTQLVVHVYNGTHGSPII